MVHCIYLCNPKGNCQEVKTLDKYEYSLKLDEIKKLVTSGNYEEAVVLATINGLKQMKSPEEVAKLRGKSVEEILA